MNDDRTDLEVFQQCRDLVFGDWTSAVIFVPLQVWIGEKLLHHLLRCYLRAVLGKHRPQCREELNSYAGLIWSTREVNRLETGFTPMFTSAIALAAMLMAGQPPPTQVRDNGQSHPVVNIRTSEHHIFPRPLLSVRMFGSWGKKRANASSKCAAL